MTHLHRLGRHVLLLLGGVLCTFSLLSQFNPPFEGTNSMLALIVLLFCCALLWLALRPEESAALPRAWAPLTRRYGIPSMGWAALVAFAYLIGEGIPEGHLWPQGAALVSWMRFCGLFLFFTCASLAYLRSPLFLTDGPCLSKKGSYVWFFGGWALLFLCWLPYYLVVYPGILSPDSMNQFAQAYQLADLDNRHPLIHTLLLKLALWLGDLIGLEYRETYGVISIFQMLGLSAVLSYAVVLLRKHVRSLGLCLLALLNFAFNPHHSLFSMTIWKDIPFSAMVLMLTLLIFRVVVSDGAVLKGWKFRVTFVTVALSVLLLRNNGAFPALISLLMLALLWRPNRAFFAAATGILVGVFLLLNGIVYPLLGIEQGELTEALSSPIQQVGRVAAYAPETLTEEQIDLIEYVLPIETIQKEYNPRSVDALKFDPQFYGYAISEDPGAYLNLWLEIVRAYPKSALTAHMILTSAFWAPERLPHTTIYLPNAVTNEWDAELYNQQLVPALSFLLDWAPDKLQRNVPILNLLMVPGIVIWVALFACACLIACGKRRYLLVLLPMLSLWGSLMLGAPLSDSRYSYSFYLILPVLLGLCIIAKRKEPAERTKA